MLLLLLRCAAALLLVTGCSAGAAGAQGSTYLALGDSVAAGIGASDPGGGGYVPVLAGLLEQRLGCDDGDSPSCPVTVRQLAVPGATTATLLRDQLPRALELLEEQPDVRLVTLTVGGNDVFRPVLQACAGAPDAPACTDAVTGSLREVDRGVDEVLAGLTAAAPEGTTVAVMTYDNPVAACRLAPLAPLAEQVLEGADERPGLNDVLRARAQEHGAVLVETAGLLSAPDDFVGGQDCLHPSATGHERIARAFLDAVDEEVVSPSAGAP